MVASGVSRPASVVRRPSSIFSKDFSPEQPIGKGRKKVYLHSRELNTLHLKLEFKVSIINRDTDFVYKTTYIT